MKKTIKIKQLRKHIEECRENAKLSIQIAFEAKNINRECFWQGHLLAMDILLSQLNAFESHAKPNEKF